MKKIMKYLLLIILIIIVMYFIFIWNTTPKNGTTGKYDEFAKCLTENEAVMYGTDWCHFCQEQKSLFEESFSYVNYKNCDYNKEECDNVGVRVYPTWRINNNNYPGLKSLEELASLTGCSL